MVGTGNGIILGCDEYCCCRKRYLEVGLKLLLVLYPRNIVINISICAVVISIRHSREGGNPGDFELDSRLRGSNNHLVTYL